MHPTPLIGLGRWRNLLLQDPLLPDAAWFVDTHWEPVERQRILTYLRQGRPLHHWMSHAQCEFRCQLPGSHMPDVELTDSMYLWPEMLIHQIEQHSVRLPAQFVAHALDQAAFPTAQAAEAEEGTAVDYTWWHAQPGWQQKVSTLSLLPPEEVRCYLSRYARGAIEYGSETAETVARRAQIVQELRQQID
ncbi:hypothetical protein [Hymenobacter sp. CRA2]|uniref:hypothetical protein n=1 Tax=Hymenobacter sp. CRA2 TaxID=1955620 RepID=UPI00098EBEFB|nr:hypothetical protein [Hymenobacter sp. CRA2]OON68693.1 hypothetical protein B0919_10890 [Hymenobacter sp. CRA2]